MILAFLIGMISMWLTVAVVAQIVDINNAACDTDHLGTWLEAWNIMPELCAVIKLIKEVK